MGSNNLGFLSRPKPFQRALFQMFVQVWYRIQFEVSFDWDTLFYLRYIFSKVEDILRFNIMDNWKSIATAYVNIDENRDGSISRGEPKKTTGEVLPSSV